MTAEPKDLSTWIVKWLGGSMIYWRNFDERSDRER